MSDTTTQNTGKTPLEAARERLEAARETTRKAAETWAEFKELAAIEDEIRFEVAHQAALQDPKLGPDKIVARKIALGGWVILRLPSAVEWNRFQNRGILKANGLSTELCDDVVTHSYYHPGIADLRAIMNANPSASVQLAEAIIEKLTPARSDEGNARRS